VPNKIMLETGSKTRRAQHRRAQFPCGSFVAVVVGRFCAFRNEASSWGKISRRISSVCWRQLHETIDQKKRMVAAGHGGTTIDTEDRDNVHARAAKKTTLAQDLARGSCRWPVIKYWGVVRTAPRPAKRGHQAAIGPGRLGMGVTPGPLRRLSYVRRSAQKGAGFAKPFIGRNLVRVVIKTRYRSAFSTHIS